MFVTRLAVATVSTIVLMAVIFWSTEPDRPRTGSGGIALVGTGRPMTTKELFVFHCAQCHGETGNGVGTTDLERPARSFLKGGYAYGNTLQAVMRTLKHGIPGTAMPAFGESLTDQERSSLARHVIGLGPPGTTMRYGESVLAVEDRPLVVHGLLADPGPRDEATGRPLETRSVAIGFPNGTTLQYRYEDAKILALRQGDFLDRPDWRGGGGSPLRALGKVTWIADPDLRDRPDFVRAADGAPLERSLRRTATTRDEVVITFDLEGPDGAIVGQGEERISFVEPDGTPVTVRTLRILEPSSGATLAPLEGAARADRFETVLAGTDLVAASPSSRRDVRVYAHVAQWTESLSSAIHRSLESLP